MDRSILQIPVQYCTIDNGPTVICIHPNDVLKITYVGKINDVLNADPATTYINILGFSYSL